MDGIIILALALTIDLVVGDPPTLLHPVGWMGKLISLAERLAPKGRPNAQFFYGIGMVLVGIISFVVPIYFLLVYVSEGSRIIYVIVGALILKSTFSIRGLRSAAVKVRDRLNDNQLADARAGMGALVSRNPEDLDEALVIAATVESVAENTSDSIVAPLFWFLILGIPGAVGYRVVNTFDSMIGYHGKYEYLGKFAARLDDVLNFIPARLTALMMVAAAFIARKEGRAAWNIMLRDHSKTESPNAGWPMSAAAGALEIELEKVGHYKLGEAKSTLTLEKINSVLLLMCLVALICAVLCFSMKGIIYGVAS
ncbi:MAG: cobalamin biosynthesis protein [Dehalococcoidia bacterium]|nr:cobalamin biosynthesis protein [Dehalococcoidia bacterium]